MGSRLDNLALLSSSSSGGHTCVSENTSPAPCCVDTTWRTVRQDCPTWRLAGTGCSICIIARAQSLFRSDALDLAAVAPGGQQGQSVQPEQQGQACHIPLLVGAACSWLSSK